MNLDIRPQSAPCGALVRGLDLKRDLGPEHVAAIRAAWLKHQVLAFPDQDLSLDDLERDKGRSMAIRCDDSALATQAHPIARVHPETGRTALFVSPGYTIGIEGMSEAEATPLLMQLFEHQVRDAFVYRHRWSPTMLVMWDNRCVVHAATGGYQGHARLLHRITLAERAAAH